MKSFLFFFHRNKKSFKKIKVFSVVVLLLFSFSLSLAPIGVREVGAQGMVVTDIPKLVWDKIQKVSADLWKKADKAFSKAATIAFQRTLATALNKVAYDAANYVGSGNDGRKKLFQDLDLGTYLLKVGDEAAGDFLETFARNMNTKPGESCDDKYNKCQGECNARFLVVDGDPSNTNIDNCLNQCITGQLSCLKNPNAADRKDMGKSSDANSFNICQPSSIEVKLKIGLGLAEQNRPSAPSCTATKMISNWGDDINKKMADIKSGNYMKYINEVFDPRSSDLNIMFDVNTDLITEKKEKTELEKGKTLANDGWLDVRNISGTLKGTPGEAQSALNEARELRMKNFGKTTGDILVDASNIFLNQLAVSAFSTLMRKINNKTQEAGESLVNKDADPNSPTKYGVSSMKEKTMVILESKFENDRELDILSELSVCINPANPSPNNCVIDDRFMQAIIEQKTVAEAIEEGNLNSNWRVEKDVFASAYNNHYSLRNIKILRKHRILPTAWEVAIERAFENKANPRYATLGDLISCFSQNDSYEDFSSKFDISDTLWCEGLIDPNWVLKAPLSYCKQAGYGSYISSMAFMEGIEVPGADRTPSSLMLIRDDNYCADNQSCIKENREGGCDAYGYCTEDRRTWSFASDSCSPLSNTCQTFTNVIDGTTASYLENTIDYGDCSSDSAGCRRYSLSGKYSTSSSISWDFSKNLFFNKNLSACDQKNEGCSELIRVKPTWGSNLVFDSGFNLIEENKIFTAGQKLGAWDIYSSGPNSSATVIDSSSEIRDITNGDGRTAKLSGNDRIGLRSTAAVFPENLQILSKQNYSLSADVYLISGDRLEIQLNPGDRQSVLAISEKGKWERVKLTANAASGFFSPNFSFIAFGSSASFYVKNVKFELGDWATAYSNYGSNKIRQKLLPNYLEEACYEDSSSATKNYSLKADAPIVCGNYARKCNYNEVGCELFTNTKDKFALPAQVVSADYCPEECLGYDIYVAKANYFNSTQAQNLIPSQTAKCSQADVGCSEFTNLDEVASGGEGKEYYSELRQCIKPDTAKCTNFYTWDGPEGLQIKTYSLQKDGQNNPLINFNNQTVGDCRDIYGLPLNDPRYNPDCREFRNTAGQVSYRLMSGLITCSDNCFNYRLSEKNIDPQIKSGADCVGSDKKWNAASSVCYSCLNGGIWDNNQNACVYKAIPGEGKTCQAKQVGCREYNGSQGNNSQLLAYYNFEDGLGAWYSSCSNGISQSSIANTKKGSSLFYNSSVSAACNEQVLQLKLGGGLNVAKAYSLKFLARSNNNNSLEIYFQNEGGDKRYYFSSVADINQQSLVSISGGNEWQVYNVNLDNIPETLGENGTLNISASSDFYLDDVLLTEINDRYYLVKDSVRIPDICSYDNLGKYQGENYNLGCYQYSDRSGLKHNLHNFDSLCSSASVGCEQMISTNNYSSALSGAWHDTNENGSCEDDEKNCVIVDRDEAVYAVYDQTKSCLNEDLGCSRLGEGLGSGLDITWSDVFKLNNPNNYENTFCVESDLGCEEYRNAQDGSLSYFVNPASNLCVYRPSNNNEIVGKAWYKAPAKRCDLNSSGSIDGNEGDKAICSSDSECASGTCLVDNNDYNCPVSYLKTIGYGGINSSIPIPDGSVALCDATVAGCTEYIDPVSKFNPNLVRNSSFDNNQGWGEDLWLGAPISETSQIINLERNKLYSFSKINNSDNKLVANGKLNFVNSVRVLQDNNYFSEPIKILDLSATSTRSYVIFNSLENYSALLTGAEIGKSIEIRELVVSYNIKDQVGAGDCAGLVDFKSGCILFNERSIAGASGLKANSFNSISTIDGRSPFTTTGPYNANQLLSVRPDRTCAKWLTCTSYTIENDKSLCTSLAECNLLDDKNECANYLIRSSQESVIFDADKNKNATGYSLPNTYYFNNIKELGLNTRARYDFEDNIPPLSCVLSDDTGKPRKGSICNSDNNINDNLVREPSTAPADYPASGKTYLKVTPGIAISPQPEGTYVLLPEIGDYYISYLVNTKNSNTSAKISIVDADTYNVITQVAATSNSTWSREVHKFSTKKKDSKVRIYLSSIKKDNSSSVYFDDVNIETVLQVGDNKYAARDCRLYPTSSALSCQETQETIVRNGVEGYCLEYDLANPGVCQLWMPIERIAAAKIKTNQAGYKGKYPLNYCAEVDSNFMFLEKRVAAVVKEESIRRNSDKYLGVRTCYYPGAALNYCRQMFFGEAELDFVSDSSSEVSSDLQVVVEYDPGNPNEGPIITVGGTHTSTSTPPSTTKITIPGTTSDYTNLSEVQKYCGDSGNYFLLVTQDLKQENGIFKRDDVAITKICMPINNSIYYGFEPSATFRYVAAKSEPISTFSGVQKVHPITDGWYLADGFHNADGKAPGNKRGGNPGGFDELVNSDPPLRVLDLNYPAPAGEGDLKKIASNNPDEVFRLTCNKFVEVVSGSGENMAWSQRINNGSDYQISPISGVNYNGYSRKIGDIPFGAASWPDNFDLIKSSRIPLYNQYSAKNKEDVYAGRPYGCAANDDNSLVNCTRVGYCSANPDVYCLLDSGLSYSDGQIKKPDVKFFNANTYDLDRHSCGSWGTCQPLWTTPGGVNNNVFKTTLKDYQAPLSQLFLQVPVAYEFKQDDGGYTIGAGYFFNNSAGTNPRVITPELYAGGQKIVVPGIKAGTHRLDFYSSVNANQQPLREIFIDWGDGFKQVITGQDSRESGQAHSFYHYYSNSRNSVVIKIKVYDNWNKSSEEFTLNK